MDSSTACDAREGGDTGSARWHLENGLSPRQFGQDTTMRYAQCVRNMVEEDARGSPGRSQPGWEARSTGTA